MLQVLFILLTTSGVESLNTNMSSSRVGKAKLLEDLKAHDAFKYKLCPVNENNTIVVNFMYEHYQILMVNEVEESMTSSGHLIMGWTDPDLTWNKMDYGAVDIVSIPYDEIWYPKIIVSNTVNPDFLTINRVESLTLNSEGYITYVTPVHLETTCSMNLKYFPFDSQMCPVMFNTLIDDVKVVFSSRSSDQKQVNFSINGQWILISKHYRIINLDWQSGLQILRLEINITRRYIYYVLFVLAPMILTASMTSMVFWIPPSPGEKISFLVTLSVTNAVFLGFISGTMARSIIDLPRLALLVIFLNLQCVAALIATIFVLRKYEQERFASVVEQQKELSMLGEAGQRIFTLNNEETSKKRRNNSFGIVSDSLFRNPRYVFKKLALTKVSPLRGFTMDRDHETKLQICRLRLSAAKWDMIFFCAFHALGLPCIFLLFAL